MKPEAQRIAIAKACGWVNVEMYQPPPNYDFHPPYEAKAFPRGMKHPVMIWNELPNYLNDLNAMAEAEKTFKDDAVLWHRYASLLDKDYVNQPYTIGATAAQRAEAFLKTIGKWQD